VIVDVKVPVLAETVSEATLLEWKKTSGEAVVRDEILIEIETDKVVLEVPAPTAGILTEIVKGNGAQVLSGEVIAHLDTEGVAAQAALPEKPPGGEKEAAAPQGKAASATVVSVARFKESAAPGSRSPREPVEAARELPPLPRREGVEAEEFGPAVRKLIAEHQLDPQQIPATGKGGRLTKGDILAYLEKQPPPPPSAPRPGPVLPPPPSPTVGARQERRVPMSRIRTTIAERLVQAQQTAAILTTFNEVNMQAVIDLRHRYQETFASTYGVRLGFMSFFTKAALQALKKFPIVNASVEGNDIVYHDYYDIGIAVSSPRGLVVPVVRDADRLTFGGIESRINEYTDKAGRGQFTIEELSGGTFTISNGGIFGSLLSTPLLNLPQSGILGMHRIQERPVVENGQIVIRPMMYLALSYDHRIIDGREAVRFLVTIKEALEDPARMLLDI
jgi:2-oxoglutarate dehydrogenase E2 component (dihydrolipoamide succinyltransferase)